MTALVHHNRLGQLLQRLPANWLAALDAWSLRVAQRQMEKRRQAAQPQRPPAPIPYQLRPWRD